MKATTKAVVVIMKKVFLILLILIVVVAAKFVHTRIYVQQMFGPSSMLAIVLFGLIIVVLFASYLLIEGEHREKLIGFWLASVSTVTTYFLVDLLAGFLLITPLSPELIPDEVRHHKLVPNAYAKFEQKDFSYVQRNNDFGLRGREVTVEKPDETYRILTLGDSFTMGKGVEDDQTFSVLLEETLNSELRGCDARYQQIEVLNGGVDSYSPIISYLYLTRVLEVLEPDMVILNLDNSDLIQEWAYRRIAIRDDQGNIVGVPGKQLKRPLSAKFRDWIESNLYITRLLLFHANKWLGYKDLTVRGVITRANAEIIAHTLMSDQIDRTLQWNDIFESLALIRDFVDARSMKFVLSLYPWAHQVSDKEWVPGRYTYMNSEDRSIDNYDQKIMSLASQSGIDVISVYESFANYGGSNPLYFDNDPHFTMQGHQLMAEEMARLLVEGGHAEGWCE
jgi:lysophospholipase L1-like esterase